MPLRLPTVLLTAATLLLGSGPGCNAVKKLIPGNKPESKLPPQELIVGGGFEIDYTAPRSGTAMLADRNRGQILITKSMDAGETYRFDFDPTLPKNRGLFSGDDLADARPTLYFLPEGFQMPAANAAPAPNQPVYYEPPATPSVPAQPAVTPPTRAPASEQEPVANPFDEPAPAVN